MFIIYAKMTRIKGTRKQAIRKFYDEYIMRVDN